MSSEESINLFLAAVLLLAALFIGVKTFAPDPQIPRKTVTLMDAWIERRLAFHGVECAICNEQGECWFLRDGKKCKL